MIRPRARALANIPVLVMLSLGAIAAAGTATVQGITNEVAPSGTNSQASGTTVPQNWGWE